MLLQVTAAAHTLRGSAASHSSACNGLSLLQISSSCPQLRKRPHAWCYFCLCQVLPGVLSSFRPQLVLYDAGVDIHQADDLGRLAVSDEGGAAPTGEGGGGWQL